MFFFLSCVSYIFVIYQLSIDLVVFLFSELKEGQISYKPIIKQTKNYFLPDLFLFALHMLFKFLFLCLFKSSYLFTIMCLTLYPSPPCSHQQGGGLYLRIQVSNFLWVGFNKCNELFLYLTPHFLDLLRFKHINHTN